jgi:ketosteroid isomerase-like protein
MELTKQQAELMDRFLIREQIENYMDALNHRDWDRLGATLCQDDFVWSTGAPVNQRFEGRQAFLDMLNTVQAYQYGFVFQMGHGIVVRELEGDRARASHTLHIYSDSVEYIGIYYDELIKEADGVWRFRRRDFRPTYHDLRHAPGSIYRRLPDPDARAAS